MKNFKKHPIFALVFALLLAVFAGGLAYDFILYNDSAAAEKKARRAMKNYETEILRTPKDESLAKADENLKALQEKLDSLDREFNLPPDADHSSPSVWRAYAKALYQANDIPWPEE